MAVRAAVSVYLHARKTYCVPVMAAFPWWTLGEVNAPSADSVQKTVSRHYFPAGFTTMILPGVIPLKLMIAA
jgi:hypothetical protein